MPYSRSLTQIFKKPLPENPTLLESLSPSYQIRPPTPTVTPAFEFFGELNFFTKNPEPHVNPPLPTPPPTPPDRIPQFDTHEPNKKKQRNAEDPLSGPLPDVPVDPHGCHTKNSEPLGFESLCDAMDMVGEGCSDQWKEERREQENGRKKNKYWRSCSDVRSRCRGVFPPPPISCIGKTGKPWVYLRPYRKDGVLVLREVRIARQKFLHAIREDGRLRMHFVHPDDDIIEAGGDDVEEDENEGQRRENQEEKDDGEVGKEQKNGNE